jgi:hypothetical protein
MRRRRCGPISATSGGRCTISCGKGRKAGENPGVGVLCTANISAWHSAPIPQALPIATNPSSSLPIATHRCPSPLILPTSPTARTMQSLQGSRQKGHNLLLYGDPQH